MYISIQIMIKRFLFCDENNGGKKVTNEQCLISEHLFNLKFAAKDLQRNARKCEKEEKAEKLKIKKVFASAPFAFVSLCHSVSVDNINVYFMND